MKFNLIYLFLLLGFVVHGQVHKENITKELRFSSQSPENLFILENINGNVAVEGYNGQTIVLEVIKTIEASENSDLETGKKEIQLGIVEKGDVIWAYMITPCTKEYTGLTSEELREGRNRNWKENCRWETNYEYQLDFRVKVPQNIMLDVSTINNGEVTLNNVSGSLIKANNINGGITLDGIVGDVELNTINGDLNLTYTKNPTGKSKYYSLNGDINAFFQKGLSADLFFESFSGDFYTSLNNLEALPVEMKEKREKEKGIAYKIGGKSGVRVGNGQAHLEFETFNGNVYVKEVGGL